MNFRCPMILAATMIALVGNPAVLQTQEAPPAAPMTHRIQEMLKTRPGDPTLYYYLAVYQAIEGDTAASVRSLNELLKLGKGFLPARGIGFEPIWDHPDFRAARDRLEAALPRVTEATELFRLGNDLIPEGITFDPDTRSYYIGSIAGRKIVRVDSTGAVSDLSKPGELQHILGVALDAPRGRLYAVSTSTLTDAGRAKPVNQVARYDLRTGKLEKLFDVPGAAQLNDVTLSPAGEVYVTDSGAGAVFRISGDGAIDTAAAPGTLPGANGLALSSDGTGLYVGHGSGVARLDLAGGPLVPRLELPPGETIAAIDGLYADGDALVGIQNVTNPGRVIRITLRKDGKGAESVETLLSHHHEAISEPTTGVIVGRTFVFLATTEIARFTAQGTVDSPETVKQPVVLRIELDRKTR